MLYEDEAEDLPRPEAVRLLDDEAIHLSSAEGDRDEDDDDDDDSDDDDDGHDGCRASTVPTDRKETIRQ